LGLGVFSYGQGQVDGFAEADGIFPEPRDSSPHAQAMLAGATECFGGLLLLAGFCSRLISIPLTILLTVAYLTADLDKVKMLFSDPDKFLTADEFLFLFVVVLVFAFGPGKFSIDWQIRRKASPSSGSA
jgi:putative oxidoreductase